MKPMRTVLAILVTIAGAAACRNANDRAEAAETSLVGAAGAQPVHVDSIFPVEEELRRFRVGLAEPSGLGRGAAASRDLLIDAFLDALAVHDTAAFAAMALDRAEFAHLYYPHTRYTRPPYELSPALLWFQLQQNSEKGLVRVLRRLGGKRHDLLDYRCDEAPEVQERNRIWTGCELRLEAGSDTVSGRWFGSILERDGRFKFISYTNGL